MYYAVIFIFLATTPDRPDYVSVAGPFAPEVCTSILGDFTKAMGELPPGYLSRNSCGPKYKADQTVASFGCHFSRSQILHLKGQPAAKSYDYNCYGPPPY